MFFAKLVYTCTLYPTVTSTATHAQYANTHTHTHTHTQVYASIVLVVLIALYGYAQPYRSTLANILELIFQTNFLILILLEGTSLIRDSLFTFPVTDNISSTRDYESGTSPLTWLLLPFYYLPVVVFVLVCTAYGVHYLWYVLTTSMRITCT